MNEHKLIYIQQEKRKIPSIFRRDWKNNNSSKFLESWKILLIQLPIEVIAIVCLYFGINMAITGSMAIIGAIAVIPIGGFLALFLILWLIPGYYIARKLEKKEKQQTN